jgi:hypothetical protein
MFNDNVSVSMIPTSYPIRGRSANIQAAGNANVAASPKNRGVQTTRRRPKNSWPKRTHNPRKVVHRDAEEQGTPHARNRGEIGPQTAENEAREHCPKIRRPGREQNRKRGRQFKMAPRFEGKSMKLGHQAVFGQPKTNARVNRRIITEKLGGFKYVDKNTQKQNFTLVVPRNKMSYFIAKINGLSNQVVFGQNPTNGFDIWYLTPEKVDE